MPKPDDAAINFASSPSLTTRRTALKMGVGLAVIAGAGTSLIPFDSVFANAWGGYQNGRIPENALTPIPWRSQYRLRSDATNSLVALNAAFRLSFPQNLPINDGYRTYDGQVTASINTCGHANGCSLAARPGTSNHGWALAIDIGVGRLDWGNPIYTWMKANAGRFGWFHPAWAEPSGSGPEAWHWEYDGTYNGPPQEEQDLNQEQDNRLRNIENLLAVPNAGYGWTQVAANNASDIQRRLGVPNAGYDYLPAIMNQMNELIGKVNQLQAKVDSLS